MGSLGAGQNHALVYGASGITGWAIVNAILDEYPNDTTFSKVTALTNRPLPPEVAQWPKSDKLQVVSGLDLLAGDQDALESTMKERVPDIDKITHVYFFAYVMDPDPEKEISINVALLERAVTAVEKLSDSLKFVVLPTGTKAYGVHLIENFPWKDKLPLSESLPRIPEPYASQMFYYNQLDILKSMSKGKSWTFCDIIPDVVVGFVPNNNIYCLAQALSLYLSLVHDIEGPGAEVVFPGTMESWSIQSNDSSQDIIARFAIYASLHPEVSAGQTFNAADNARSSSWSVKWPVICEYFGLKGVAPTNGSGPDPVKYTVDNRERWLALEKKFGLQTGRVGNERSFGGFPYFIMTMFNFERPLDMTKMHKAWGSGKEETDTKGAWWTAFDRFRKAKIIP
ncbi:hypothetical protein LTR10_018689 [Elasticomyces elasticus]|uniref:PRISE-like Rossmann-fold domain-containing protein n=1 Tax=Exophiala sideris TaxID=1016849 RepID=A0ABR0JS63_9EURO|nr:hypothetical protein LTR10_018689 [Elasticomyces elasticus]KAK5040436.1 hypothetical protein LTS07_000934 [Exophiala sideris]KAK5043138.1 hypothetical protein LTR13_000909 [Exophiala sideris]KAK5068814.1 hypothetical protein LTR69_000935 [Exophiala sideris]KAK5186411.1 hypothetical protein LTR44_001467 [Eurotiomycetes sp. CCFEE 6388]